ncbi:hypothetical protein RclHR1_14590012 [Rhizophagus clarus]|uniref:Reverse transcriptase domain-containing protein n=1 Tax=Rhizophagus clarus TaxID=94130 RepID=A0A2Z6QCX0_9GLOM|nr:hypothetical protein RclHR1_14590012 [Rhizophagus clarus]
MDNNFTLPFLQKILKDINKASAFGTSGITYQLMYHFPPAFVEVILALYRTIFLAGLVPADWQKSMIFPIPKPDKFEYNMFNVRPIALLEVVRKIFTKFISMQFTNILQDHNILCNANYCELKGDSTASPIRLINNIIEDVKENSKELWIVLQDISKAFDSISLDFLELALNHIGLPPHAVRCIINLFKGRNIQVTTAFGLQLTTFTKPEWDAIERPILALVKHTIGVQRSFPTLALYHEGIIGLHRLWIVVSTTGIMNLCMMLNAHNDATFTTLL